MTDAAAPLVLVADDEPDILRLVSFTLEAAGFAVAGARDGEEALQAALERRPALAVLDVSMPRLDGCEVTRRLRRDPRTESMPIVLLTAFVQDEQRAQGLAAGADVYVSKPFSGAALVRTARELTAGAGAEEPHAG